MNRDELAKALAYNFSNHPKIKEILENKHKKLTFKKQQIERLSIIFRRANIPFDPDQIETHEQIVGKLTDIIMKKSYALADKIIMLTNQK